VGTALGHLNKVGIGIAWHQKDLKYSALAGDVAGSRVFLFFTYPHIAIAIAIAIAIEGKTQPLTAHPAP
jgi:hypothetical protein